MDKIEQSINLIAEKKRRYPKGAIIFYSGGKDAITCLDLAVKVYDPKDIVLFTMFLVPGISFIEESIRWAQERYPGVRTLSSFHWLTFKCMRDGVFGFPNRAVKKATLESVQNFVRGATGLRLVIDGSKNADGFFKRRVLAARRYTNPEMLLPVKDWNKWDVLSYLKSKDIPIPQLSADATGNVSGVDLTTFSLLWLHDKKIEDFKRVASYFPFVWAVVKRREWFGEPKPTR